MTIGLTLEILPLRRAHTLHAICYGVATISRLLKIVDLSCKRALQKRLYSAKKTYNFKEPINRSHPIVSSIWIFSKVCIYYEQLL